MTDDHLLGLAHVWHVTWTEEPCYLHWDGHIRPCRPPHDTIAAPHRHEDGKTYGGADHRELKEK